MAELDTSIITLCLPLVASALKMSASLIPDKEAARELNQSALVLYLSVAVSLYLDYLRQRFHLQGNLGENLFYKVLINPLCWVVPNGGNLFIFITAFFIPISFNHSYLKVFWIFVYFAFSSLLYIYGLFESNNWLK